mmetsp:Transcript_124337/g.264934  ORF Transcript_124337/g.264934 Transcript_124337/m.264934 type:complete len:416 (-) Transcript_124337:93-1340(-)
MASTFLTIVYVMGLLTCGSLNTITMKISFTFTSVGVTGDEQVFMKPWFITFIMFVAMSFALIFDGAIRRCEPCRGVSDKKVPLIDASPGGLVNGNQAKLSWSKKVVMVALPSFFDILATGLCCMGFLYIPASVWQLLRGAEMVFAAIFAVTCLGRKLFVFHWLGLLLCVMGIVLVGLASIWGEECQGKGGQSSDDQNDSGLVFLGMGLCLAGQVVQAAQVVAEEWLLNDVDLPGMQIVGFEGIWGGLAMLAFAFPILYWIPGSDHGHLEDERDTAIMMHNNPHLVCMVLIYTFSCCTYNMAGIAVTGALSAVHRVMLEALRTSIVWGFGLTVHYVYDPKSKFGEAWTPYSWYEVAGFAVLILGQAIYGAMIRIPGLRYPAVEAVQPIASPSQMRNLASPLPPAEFKIVDETLDSL